MKASEKRGSPRVPYVSEVVCEGEGRSLTARTSDISASGVFIHSRRWCEAGTILKLSFNVASTQIETMGEVCYSIPLIGMGVRFLDLQTEYQAILQSLIENQLAEADSEGVKSQARHTIPSGVEPVDQLFGGFESGQLYLTYGDAAGKSLLGIQFLIEGLKRGEHGAIVTTCRLEDIVRRFARLGYDCREDIRSAALVFFRCSSGLDEVPNLEPLLRELGPILDESSAERIVFDPVDDLLAGPTQNDLTARADELAVWVRSFGATVVLVANGEKPGVIESLTPSVRESFRFEFRDTIDRVVRFIAFEKSPGTPDQAVRVDPSRGIFLLQGHQVNQRSNYGPGITLATPAGVEAGSDNIERKEPVGDAPPLDHGNEDQASNEPVHTQESNSTSAAISAYSDRPEAPGKVPGGDLALTSQLGGEDNGTSSSSSVSAENDGIRSEEASEAFFAMLDELQTFASSLEQDAPEMQNGAIPDSSPDERCPNPLLVVSRPGASIDGGHHR